MIDTLIEVIANVETMGGDPLSELLAPSEIRAVAESIVGSGVLRLPAPEQSSFPPHFAWMALIPAHMHDCFSG